MPLLAVMQLALTPQLGPENPNGHLQPHIPVKPTGDPLFIQACPFGPVVHGRAVAQIGPVNPGAH